MSSRLNYQHLFYFHVVCRARGLKRAAVELGLSHSTLSTQIRALERSVGVALFDRVGRGLTLTDEGRLAQQYAESIFGLGDDFLEELSGENPSGARLRVGIVDAVPRLIVRQLLGAVLAMSPPARVTCRSDRLDAMLTALALHTLDVVIADAPVPPGLGVRAFAHPLGECGVTFLADATLADRLLSPRRGFPECLDGAPLLVPPVTTALRRSLDAWLHRQALRPVIVAEIEDVALVKALCVSGLGVFAAPSVVEAEICAQYGVRTLGRTEEIKERFYAISAERRIRNAATLTLTRARLDLFAGGAPGAG